MHPYVYCSIIYNSQDTEETCLSTDEWIKMREISISISIIYIYVYIYIYTYKMDYYLVVEKNEVLPSVTT